MSTSALRLFRLRQPAAAPPPAMRHLYQRQGLFSTSTDAPDAPPKAGTQSSSAPAPAKPSESAPAPASGPTNDPALNGTIAASRAKNDAAIQNFQSNPLGEVQTVKQALQKAVAPADSLVNPGETTTVLHRQVQTRTTRAKKQLKQAGFFLAPTVSNVLHNPHSVYQQWLNPKYVYKHWNWFSFKYRRWKFYDRFFMIPIHIATFLFFVVASVEIYFVFTGAIHRSWLHYARKERERTDLMEVVRNAREIGMIPQLDAGAGEVAMV